MIKGGRERQLDVIRGCAILLAMGWHLNKPTNNVFLDSILWPGRTFGWAGVDIFFVLSGFLIGGLIIDEVDKTGSFNTRRFLARRILRLWPVLYCFLIIQVALNRFPIGSYIPQIILHVQNYFRTPLSHLWSLAVEEQFYLVAGFCAPLVAARDLKARTMVISLLLFILLVTLIRTAFAIGGLNLGDLQSGTQFRADSLASGVVLAVCFKRCPVEYAILKDKTSLWAFIWVSSLFVIAYIVPSSNGNVRPIFGYPAATALSVSTILLIQGRIIPKLLNVPVNVLAWLGLYSYSLYVFHVGIGGKGGAYLARFIGRDTPVFRIILGYSAAIIAAYVLTKIIERPFMILRDRLYPRVIAVSETG